MDGWALAKMSLCTKSNSRARSPHHKARSQKAPSMSVCIMPKAAKVSSLTRSVGRSPRGRFKTKAPLPSAWASPPNKAEDSSSTLGSIKTKTTPFAQQEDPPNLPASSNSKTSPNTRYPSNSCSPRSAPAPKPSIPNPQTPVPLAGWFLGGATPHPARERCPLDPDLAERSEVFQTSDSAA